MTRQLLDRASDVLSSRGFSAWEVFLVEKDSALVGVGGGRRLRSHSAADTGCGLRGLLEGHSAYASTTRLDAAGLRECADALALSCRSGSAGRSLPLPAPEEPGEPFEACDPAAEGLTLDRMADIARQARAALSPAWERTIGITSSCRSMRGTIALRNSLGLDLSARFSRVDLRLEGEIGEGFPKLVAWTSSFGPSELDPAGVGRAFSRMAAARTSSRPAGRARENLVLSPRASAHLAGLCAFLVDGERARARAKSSAPCEAVGSSAFTLRDDGRLEGGYGSTPFDGEGVQTATRTFVERGVLRGFAHTAASAEAAGVSQTGNSLRPDFAFPPALGFHNLHLGPAGDAPRDGVQGIPRGIYLEEVWGVSPDLSPGRVALEGWGHQIVRGELADPVRGLRIEGALGDLLLKLSAVGSDLATFPGGIGGATCLIEDVPLRD